MSTPQPNDGLKQAARVSVQIARRQLEQCLPQLGSDTDEGKAVLSALKTLSGVFGKNEEKDNELIPSEILGMLSNIKDKSPGGAAMAAKPPIPAGAPAPAMA